MHLHSMARPQLKRGWAVGQADACCPILPNRKTELNAMAAKTSDADGWVDMSLIRKQSPTNTAREAEEFLRKYHAPCAQIENSQAEMCSLGDWVTPPSVHTPKKKYYAIWEVQ